MPMAARVVTSLAVGTLAAVAAVAIAQAVHAGSGKGIESARIAQARAFRVVLMLAFTATYALSRPDRRSLLGTAGFLPGRAALRSYGAGFLAGAVSVIVVVVLLTASGARILDVRAGGGGIAWLAVKYVLTGLVLVVIEEGLFRGLLQHDIRRSFGTGAAVIAGSLFFAITHFLGVTKAWRLLPDAAPSGFDIAAATLLGIERAARDWPQLVGLFFTGVVLAILRLATGTLWLAMGVHAGWYWVVQIDQVFVQHVDLQPWPRFWLGSEKYLDGVVGWIALAGTIPLALALRSVFLRSRRLES